MKYRFKTEQEFIKEGGIDWMFDVTYDWVSYMDVLFGKEIDDDISDIIMNKYYYNDVNFKILSCYSFSYNKNTITINKPLVPTYKPRKLIKNEISY